CVDARIHRPDGPADLDPRTVGKPGVEHGDVGTERGDAVRGIHGRARLTDDLDVAGGLQERPDPLTHDLVVVEQVDTDLRALRHGPRLPRSCPGAHPFTFPES